MARVSVVLPVFNHADYVRLALDSVFAQTFQDFEVVVVDDGSTDGTPRVLEWYGSRIHVIRQENRGPAEATNVGIRAAKGEWIALISADDIWYPTRLERQVREAAARPEVRFLCSDYDVIDARGRLLWTFTYDAPRGRVRQRRALLLGCFVNASTVLARRSLFDEIGLFPEGERFSPDYDLWLRLSRRHEIAYVPEVLVGYRVHGSQGSANKPEMTRATFRVLARELRGESAYTVLGTLLGRAQGELLSLVRTFREGRPLLPQLRVLGEAMQVLVGAGR